MRDAQDDEYEQAVSAVTAAREDYDKICAAHGTKSWGAERARDYLMRSIRHRDEVRRRHDTPRDE